MQSHVEQFQFPSLLYDSLFGLVIYFSLDSFLEIKDPIHLIFYLFSTIIIIHWWLMFKSAAEVFGKIIHKSALNLVLNILYIILIQYYVLMSAEFLYNKAIFFIFVLFLLDLIWAFVWRQFLPKHTKKRAELSVMIQEINHIIYSDLFVILGLFFLMLVNKFISAPIYVLLFILIYSIYIVITFKYKIIDLKIV